MDYWSKAIKEFIRDIVKAAFGGFVADVIISVIGDFGLTLASFSKDLVLVDESNFLMFTYIAPIVMIWFKLVVFPIQEIGEDANIWGPQSLWAYFIAIIVGLALVYYFIL